LINIEYDCVFCGCIQAGSRGKIYVICLSKPRDRVLFLCTLFGAVSILLPVPDSLTVFTISGLKVGGAWVYEPVWIAVAAGVGSAIGEFSGYLLGFGGKRLITGRYKKNVDFVVKVFNKYGSLAIFIFALTPLPDDVIFIPLGIMHYNPIKVFVPALIGKFLFNLILAYGGRFSIDFIEDAFGVGNELITSLIIFAAGIILTIVLLRFDWGKYFDKYLSKSANFK
jgi:membrane protein YqaA with SNARE-associated domain